MRDEIIFLQAYRKLSLTKDEKSLPGLKNYSNEQIFFLWYARTRCYAEYNSYKDYLERLCQKQSTGHAIDEFR